MISLNKVLVIGAGTMGSGIAQWFSQQGSITHLSDSFSEALSSAEKKVHASWDKLETKGKFKKEEISNFKDLFSTVEMNELNDDYDLVIEAIIEDETIKRELFQKLDLTMAEKTIFASNTSSIPISSMAKELSQKRKEKFLGLHFFNPAPIMKLVEVIAGSWSDENLCQELYAWFDAKGKKPAMCKDSPGFIVNRVARNFYGESLRIVNTFNEEKIALHDKVLKEVGGFKMGPFELMDLIGIDVNLSVTKSVWKSYYYEPRFAPHRLQEQMVESGRGGRKSKIGFYKYS